MRVVWNIVENTDIDNLERVATTLRSFGRMIRHIAAELGVESKFGAERTCFQNNKYRFFLSGHGELC